MRIGPPRKGEVREKLTSIGCKVDQETLDALDELEAAIPDEIKVGRRSEAIRAAILEARKRLNNKEST